MRIQTMPFVQVLQGQLNPGAIPDDGLLNDWHTGRITTHHPTAYPNKEQELNQEVAENFHL